MTQTKAQVLVIHLPGQPPTHGARGQRPVLPRPPGPKASHHPPGDQQEQEQAEEDGLGYGDRRQNGGCHREAPARTRRSILARAIGMFSGFTM